MAKGQITNYKEYPGVYWLEHEAGDFLVTSNYEKGIKVYGERLFSLKGEEYRSWTPARSKLASSLLSGLEPMPIKPGSSVLYLGASTGTTVSHVSDIVGSEGIIYAVEFAPRMARELVSIMENRENVVSICADARYPENYASLIPEKVDIIFADVAQPTQAQLVKRNADFFLKEKGSCLMAIKARSISQSLPIAKIFEEQINYMVENGFELIQRLDISSFHKEHVVFHGQFS
jgi:fibrillarin-like pre-rRNA processing protein